jgi:hypothetical protein
MPNLLPKLSRLKIDRSRGAALLLCLLELAEKRSKVQAALARSPSTAAFSHPLLVVSG